MIERPRDPRLDRNDTRSTFFPVARAESELFRRRCNVIEKWDGFVGIRCYNHAATTTSRHVCKAEASARIASELPCPTVHHQTKKPLRRQLHRSTMPSGGQRQDGSTLKPVCLFSHTRSCKQITNIPPSCSFTSKARTLK